MRNGELSRFGVELYYGTVLADEFWPSFLCNCVVANKRGDSIHKTIPSVFQIRHGSLVNDLSKRASWPDRWHISVRLNIAKKLAHGLGDPSDGLHDQTPPPPSLEGINWNAAHNAVWHNTLTPSLAQLQNGSQTSTTVNSCLANTPP